MSRIWLTRIDGALRCKPRNNVGNLLVRHRLPGIGAPIRHALIRPPCNRDASQSLVADHSASGFLRFAALFVPVWVAWQGYMAYATRFDTDDLAFRLAFFGAMLGIEAR